MSQVPMQFVLAACSMVPAFVIGDWHWANFPMASHSPNPNPNPNPNFNPNSNPNPNPNPNPNQAMLIWVTTCWALEGMAQMLSVSPRVLFGLFNYLNLWFCSFLFCGMFVDPDDVIWPLRLFCYFLPLRWALQSCEHGHSEYSISIGSIAAHRASDVRAVNGRHLFHLPRPA